jgi:hypothetical protein
MVVKLGRTALALAGAVTVALALAPAANASAETWQLPQRQHAAAATPAVTPAVIGNGTYTGIVSTRALDTRNGVGAPKQAVATGAAVAVQVAGIGAVPSSGVSAVVVNVTGLQAAKPGYVLGWSHTSAQPHTSILNYPAGSAGTSNEVTLQVGTDGKVSLLNGGPSPVHLVADLVGYYAAGTPSGGGYGALDPIRLYDSRQDPSGKYLGPGEGIAGPVTGTAIGVPDDASAVLVNISALNATRPGYFYGYASGAARPHTSIVGYSAGNQAIANEVVIPVGADGKIVLENSATGSVQLIVDLVGYFANATAPADGGLVTVAPSRALDTRPKSVAQGGTVTVPMLATNGIPAAGVSAVVVNVTTLGSSAQGYLIAWPSMQDRPHTSVINFATGQAISNEIVLPVGSDGAVTFYNAARGTVQLILDVVGYYTAPPPLQ